MKKTSTQLENTNQKVFRTNLNNLHLQEKSFFSFKRKNIFEKFAKYRKHTLNLFCTLSNLKLN